eukprot:GHVO01028153.1.p1 GENE.GHVO01028153.1~~GHVO01028153.1.p1  ORF type:complete len:434 (+),score=37.44 GHVO01028153.1:720-2021(+)
MRQFQQIISGAHDPKLHNGNLRGKIVLLLVTVAALFGVFSQSLIFNYSTTGRYVVPMNQNSFFGPSQETLTHMGALNTNMLREGDIARLFWAMWMHSGWLHLVFNLLIQAQFLYMMEPKWGFVRCSIVFWFSGITGSLLSATADPCVTSIGSSGALFGLICASILYYVEFWDSIKHPRFLTIWAVLLIVVFTVMGFSSSTDNWAHMGGIVGGLFSALGSCRTVPRCTCIADAYPGWCYRGDDGPTEVLHHGREEEGNRRGSVPSKRRVSVATAFSQTSNYRFDDGKWRWGWKEWATRGMSWAIILTVWTTCFVLLFGKYEFQPIGGVTFKGVSKCCCCYEFEEQSRGNWKCYPCGISYTELHPAPTWADYCSGPKRVSQTVASVLNNTEYRNSERLEFLNIEELEISRSEKKILTRAKQKRISFVRSAQSVAL